MPSTARSARGQSRRARSALRGRLEARREEIEAAALTRVKAISDPSKVSDPAYSEGLRAAVAAAISYGIETTGREGSEPPIPVALLAQARLAARNTVPLDTVLRRYFAGYSLLGYFVLEEAAHAGIADGEELKRLLGLHAGIFDRLLTAVGEEHGRETEAMRSSSRGRRHSERFERLLAGEPIETSEVGYDFEGWHLGLVAAGPEAERRVRKLAATAGCRLLCVPREGATIWAWLGARRRLDPAELPLPPDYDPSDGEAVALGEPGEALAGWRLTHRQAAAALPVALRSRAPVVRYAEVALQASALRDELLATSLRHLYIEPLQRGRDGGRALRETLRAYLRCGRNVTSAAAALGTARNTVDSRLRAAEAAIGRPLSACSTQLEVALGMAESADGHR